MTTNSQDTPPASSELSTAALTKIVDTLTPRRVLVVGYGGALAAIALRHAESAAWVGTDCEKPSQGLRCLDYRRASSVAEAAAALRDLKPDGTFDLILIDHHHGIDTLREQVALCIAFADSQTTWVFDDAVPQDLVMAADRPASGWWVGSVWRLPSWEAMRRASFCACLDSKPTGLLLVRGIDRHLVDAKFELQGPPLDQIDSLEELRSLLPFVTNQVLLQTAEAWAQERFEREYTYVRSIEPREQLPTLTRTSITEDTRFDRPPPSLLLVQASHVGHRFDANVTVENFGQGLFTLSKAVLLGTNMMVSEEDVIINRYASAGVEILERVAKSHGQYHGEGSGLIWKNGRAAIPKARIADAQHLKGDYFLVTPDERDNWGMWLLLALPSLHWYVNHRSEFAGVICYTAKAWQRQFLQAYGLKPSEIVEHQLGMSLAVDRLTWIGRHARNLAVSEYDLAALRAFVQSEPVRSAISPIGGARRIYISRVAYSRDGYRQLTEEAELEQGLCAMGFVPVQPERYGLPVQARIFADADVVIGPGGAGLFNTVFCKPGTQVLTIEGTSTWVHAHVNLFNSLGLDAGVILGWEEEADSRPAHKRWHVNVAESLAGIAQWIASSENVDRRPQ